MPLNSDSTSQCNSPSPTGKIFTIEQKAGRGVWRLVTARTRNDKQRPPDPVVAARAQHLDRRPGGKGRPSKTRPRNAATPRQKRPQSRAPSPSVACPHRQLTLRPPLTARRRRSESQAGLTAAATAAEVLFGMRSPLARRRCPPPPTPTRLRSRPGLVRHPTAGTLPRQGCRPAEPPPR